MPKQLNILVFTCLALLALYGCRSQTLAGKEHQAQINSADESGKVDANKLLVVDCLLPGQIRKLGTSHTFIAPRRPIRTTAVNCEIRGGEYVAFDRADYRTALNVWLESAKQGDAKSQVYVGEIFEKGLGSVPDYTQAAAWYRKAALQGNSRGSINLGYLYEKGLGVEKDTIEALNWYRKASGLEDDDLQFASTIEAANEQQLGQLRQELSQSQSEVAALRARLNSKEQQLQREQSALNSSEKTLGELRRELDRRRQLSESSDPEQFAALQSGLQEQQNRVDRQRAENARLKSRLEKQQSQLDRELEASQLKQQQFEQDMERQRAELEKLREELGNSRQQLATAQQQLNQSNSQIKTERERANQTRQKLVSTTSEKQDTVLQLQNKIREREADIEQLRDDLTGELDAAGSRNQALQQDLLRQRTELRLLSEHLINARQQLTISQEQLDTLNRRLESEQNKNNQAQKQLASTTTEKRDMILQLQSEIQQREAGMERLQASLDREVEKAGSLEQQLQQELAQQRQETEALSAQYEQSQKNLTAAEADLEKFKVLLAEEQSKSKQSQQAFVESASANLAEIQRLEAEVGRREAELDKQRGHITNLQSEMASYKEQLQSTQEANDRVALQGPSIEILDPPITLTRGVPSVQLRSVMKERTVTGKVTAPSGLLTLSVNDRARTPDEFGVFRAQIPVEDRQTPVNVVAVDKQGKSTSVSFEIIPKLRLASSPLAVAESSKRARSSRRYPVDFGNYYALIIGNNNYLKFPDLNSAVNDAKAANEILRDKYGFETTLIIDADRYAVLSTLNKLREKLTENDNLLIYYAGHGELDKVNLRGHWLPTDAEPNSTANWISNVDITDILNTISAKHVLVVADSCYSGTMTRTSLARLETGMANEIRLKWLKVMAKTRSRTALTSGGLKPVLDSGAGDHSIFANAFLQILRDNNDVLEGYKVYRQILDQVKVAAAKYNLEQTPQYAPILHGGHESGEFFFVPKNVRVSDTTTRSLNVAYLGGP